MKKYLSCFLCVITFFCLSSCALKNESENTSTITTVSTTEQQDSHEKNAENSMKSYLLEYDIPFSEFQYLGIKDISNKKFIVYQHESTPNYKFYIDIENDYNIYGGYDNSEIELLYENTSLTNDTYYSSTKTYLPGYENNPEFIELMNLESCTNPDELANFLENLYGEKISYYFLDYVDNKNDVINGFYEEPYNNYICSVNTIYNAELSFLIESDTYVFWGENSSETYFIMDESGSYLVGHHDEYLFDDGSSAQSITAWLLSDLYLSAHGYINADSDSKTTYREMAYGIEVYKSFEQLLN